MTRKLNAYTLSIVNDTLKEPDIRKIITKAKDSIPGFKTNRVASEILK